MSGASINPPAKGQVNGFAIASLVLGIAGLFMGLPSIVATIFGVVAMRQIRRNRNDRGRKLAVAGLVLGIVGIVVWLALAALVILFVMALGTITM